MLKKLQHKMLELHTSHFIYCTSDSMANNCAWPGAVVKAACLESRRSRVSSLALTFRFQRNDFFLSCSLVKIQYCGKPPRQRGSVFVLGPLGLEPGLEFRILCPEGSVISFISPSSGSPDPIYPIAEQM